MESTIRTTVIGSFPHREAHDALQALEKFPLSLPAWPQLPKRCFREAMVPQYSEGFPGVCIDDGNRRIWIERSDELLNAMASFYEALLGDSLDSFAVSPQYAAGLHAFLDAAKSAGTKLAHVKGQVTGPFTFGLSLNDNEGKAVWFDEQYRDIVVKGLAKKALWQARQLSELAENVLIFFDEPIFAALGTPAYMGIEDETVIAVVNECSDAVHEVGVATGIHCCGNMDWSLLARTSIDIISFDAYAYGDKVALYPEAINEFLERGGTLAWGIVPTGDAASIDRETTESLRSKIDALTKQFTQKGISEQKLRGQQILTPSCGMGNCTPESSEKVLHMLAELRDCAA
jgi:methionine synthase II (cobalamin-independent)